LWCEEDEFDASVVNEEYKKIHKQVVEYTTPIFNAMKELPIYLVGFEFARIGERVGVWDDRVGVIPPSICIVPMSKFYI
jgi:hypothetical protein